MHHQRAAPIPTLYAIGTKITVAELSLELLFGPFQATHNGLAITGLTSDRLRALLAYLAVEADRSHLRPSLAVFLWPEAGYQEACSSLRYALAPAPRPFGDPGADAPYLIVLATSAVQPP